MKGYGYSYTRNGVSIFRNWSEDSMAEAIAKARKTILLEVEWAKDDIRRARKALKELDAMEEDND